MIRFGPDDDLRPLPTRREVLAAAKRISGHVVRTPSLHAPRLSEASGCELILKAENLQRVSAFKARGAINTLLQLSPAQRRQPIVTYSSGNHGQAVAWCARERGARVRVFVPEDVDPSKARAIEAWGAELVLEGADCVETENAARAHAAATGASYVPPYNDPVVIAGQGTCGYELAQQLPEVDALFVALGGGGLIAGMATYLRSVRPDLRVIGCSPERSPALHECMKAGRVVDVPCHPTLSDATAGGVEPGAITVDLCKELLDESLLVSEAQIADAMREYIDAHHQLIEGSAAVALAALKRERARFKGQTTAVVICGGNIGRQKLVSVLNL